MGGHEVPILLVGIVIVAVVFGPVSFGDSTEPIIGGGDTVRESSTPVPRTTAVTQTPTATPHENASTINLSVASVKPNTANLSTTGRTAVYTLVSNFTEELPENETERRHKELTAAKQTCNASREIEKDIDTRQLKKGGKKAQTAARRMAFFSQIINERYTTEINTKQFSETRNNVETVTKYTPIVGSLNRMADASCRAAKYENETAIKQFRWSVLMVGVDMALIQSNVLYKPAFRATGITTNQLRKVGLWRLRRLCGDRCLALTMSEMYAISKGGLYAAIDSTLRHLDAVRVTKEDVDWQWIAEQQGWNVSRLPENFPHRTKIVQSAESVYDCREGLTGNAWNASVNATGHVQNVTGINASNPINSTSEQIGEFNASSAVNETDDQIEGADIRGLLNESSEKITNLNASSAINRTSQRGTDCRGG